MLVDDEFTVRKRVIDKIDWHKYGFEIVCEAGNGQEALEMFQQYIPDVVITDIKMPYMDGLELSERILQSYPYTKIIILTGFDEFEYAKKSIGLQIVDYILKPISSKTLIEVLQNIKIKIDDEIQTRRDLNYLQQHYEKSYPIMKNSFLKGLVHGEYYDNQEIIGGLEYYEVELESEAYAVSVISIDSFHKERPILGQKESELKKIALLNIMDEVDQRVKIGTYFLDGDKVILILQLIHDDELEFLRTQSTKLEEIRQGVEKYLPYTVTIGVGYRCSELEQLNMSLQSALNAHDYKKLVGKNRIIYIQDLESNHKDMLQFSEAHQRRLVRSLKSGNKEEFHEVMGQIFLYIKKSQVSFTAYEIYLYEVITVLIRTAKEMDMDINKLFTINQNIYKHLRNLQDLGDILNEFLEFGDCIVAHNAKGLMYSADHMVLDAKKYILENFREPDLNVDQISTFLHYSPNYFSSTFKKVTGQAFMTYLLMVRLEAGKDLLATTDKKTFEIAMDVGFSSPNYFSFCFKKHVGISPSAYRKKQVAL